MPQQRMVRAVYHDGTPQLLEPVDLPDGAELYIAVSLPLDVAGAMQKPLYPTRPQAPETLGRVRSLIAAGGDALANTEALYDDHCA